MGLNFPAVDSRASNGLPVCSIGILSSPEELVKICLHGSYTAWQSAFLMLQWVQKLTCDFTRVVPPLFFFFSFLLLLLLVRAKISCLE